MPVYQREYLKRAIGKPPWYYCFRYRKQCYRQSGFMTKAEAQIAEEVTRKEVILGDKPRSVTTILNFKELFDKFMETRQFTNAPGTVIREKLRIKSFLKAFCKTNVNRISPADINWFVQSRKKSGLANRSVNLELTLLRSIFRYGVEIESAVRNPAKDVSNLPETRKQVVIPTHSDFIRLIEIAAKTPNGFQFVAWLWFRAYTGTRPSESLSVKWSDIDFDRGVVQIESRKGSQENEIKERHVDLHPNLTAILFEWRKEWEKAFEKVGRIHDYVFFHHITKEPMSDGFDKIFRETREKAKLPLFTSHGLRHYFISHALMSGIPKETIMKWVGHTTTKMIDTTYGHLQREYQAEQMQKFSFFHPKKSEMPGENDKPKADFPCAQINPENQ